MRADQIAVAGRIQPGELVLVDGGVKVIAQVKRAAGRKPAEGENLHLVAEDGYVIRINSTVGVRVSRKS